jgi:hypothetical protein
VQKPLNHWGKPSGGKSKRWCYVPPGAWQRLSAYPDAPMRKADGPEFDDKFQAVGFLVGRLRSSRRGRKSTATVDELL